MYDLALWTGHWATAWSWSQQIYVHGPDNCWWGISEIFPCWNWTYKEVPCSFDYRTTGTI